MPTSSTVWWASTSTSPSHLTFKSKRPCRARWLSMWLKNPTPVASSCRPVPSRSSDNSTFVPVVSRRIVAVGGMQLDGEEGGYLFEQRVDLYPGPDGNRKAVAVARVAHVTD